MNSQRLYLSFFIRSETLRIAIGAKIQLHGNSIRIGDVDGRTPYSIELFDNSKYMANRRIGFIQYNGSSYDHWLAARNFIRNGN